MLVSGVDVDVPDLRYDIKTPASSAIALRVVATLDTATAVAPHVAAVAPHGAAAASLGTAVALHGAAAAECSRSARRCRCSA